MMRHLELALVAIGIVALLQAPAGAAQDVSGTLHLVVRAGGHPVEGAEVAIGGLTYRTDATGQVLVRAAPGAVTLTISKDGFVPATAALELAAGERQEVTVILQVQPTLEEHVTVVATTRTGKRLEDQALRVELLAREEIEEKMLMTPGDIVMMLNELGGMRVQATSPSLGAASVRMQGAAGRYTRVLSDGLPLYGEISGLGLLQIPPMDLGQVEVIKGVASALYGAGAMGGVVNLISRRPAGEPAVEFLLNRSTRGGTDAVGFLSAPLTGGWSASLLSGGHWQEMTDANEDGWADMAGYNRAIVRPRLFWDGRGGRTFFATGGFTYEDRSGGTVAQRVLPATGEPYTEALETRRFDAGAVGQLSLPGGYVLAARAAFVHARQDHRAGLSLERAGHETAFGEVTLRGTAGRQTWVGGLAVERDTYDPRDVPRFAYSFTVPGVFIQYDVDVTPAVSLSSSARIDVHSKYGTFLSPRISALGRRGAWTSRLSVGAGFAGPTPVTEETQAAGLTRLTIEEPLKAERGLGASFDMSRTDGPLSYTATLFSSRVTDPVHVDRSSSYVLRNLPDASATAGVELLGTLRHEPFAVTATYAYVRARQGVDGLTQDVPLTPRHGAGVVGVWEVEGAGRLGVEWYYTGRQRLEENPFRSTSDPYVILGVLAEKGFGRVRLFINGENLTGVRQTRWNPLLRPGQAFDGRWTVDAWAPLEGRTVNGGLRLVL